MHLEKQVTFLGKNSKIILFIVEGVTDEISLSLVLSRIIERGKVALNVIHLVDTDGAYIHDDLILVATKIENSFPIFERCLSPFRYCKRSEQYLFFHLIGQYGSGFTSILLHHSSLSEQKYESGKSYNKDKILTLSSNLRLSNINSNLATRLLC
jgi:hypothetical protein